MNDKCVNKSKKHNVCIFYTTCAHAHIHTQYTTITEGRQLKSVYKLHGSDKDSLVQH